ncbi:MAG: hypothetical protein QM820_08605 [Minicystis sp.]
MERRVRRIAHHDHLRPRRAAQLRRRRHVVVLARARVARARVAVGGDARGLLGLEPHQVGADAREIGRVRLGGEEGLVARDRGRQIERGLVRHGRVGEEGAEGLRLVRRVELGGGLGELLLVVQLEPALHVPPRLVHRSLARRAPRLRHRADGGREHRQRGEDREGESLHARALYQARRARGAPCRGDA